MTTAPTVSVLLTAYNRERYIASSIESVLAQTFGDFELLITDNCSTDGTLKSPSRYTLVDSRVRVVVNERNLGQFGNRNRAAELSRGSLLKYHDSDDLMYPHCLAAMVAMLQSEPRAGFGLSSGSAWTGGPCPMLLTPRMAYQREYLRRRPLPVRAGGRDLPGRGVQRARRLDRRGRAIRLLLLAAGVHTRQRSAAARRSVLVPDAPVAGISKREGADASTRTPRAWDGARWMRPSAR